MKHNILRTIQSLGWKEQAIAFSVGVLSSLVLVVAFVWVFGSTNNFETMTQGFLQKKFTLSGGEIVSTIPLILLVLAGFYLQRRYLTDIANGLKSEVHELDEKNRQLGERYATTQRRLKEIEFTDPATGVPNLALFKRDFPTFKANAEHFENTASRDAVWLAALDLVDFKNVNTTFRLSGGDRAIFIFSQRMNQTMRRNEHFYRRFGGGDDFVILFQTRDDQDALFFIRRLMLEMRKEYSPEILRAAETHAKHLHTEGLISEMPTTLPRELIFRVGMTRISSDDTSATALEKADLFMDLARKNSFGTRVVWQELSHSWNKVKSILDRTEFAHLDFQQFYRMLDDQRFDHFGDAMQAERKLLKSWSRLIEEFSSVV